MEPLDQITPNEIVRIAEEKGRSFKSIKTNQIRNVFAAIISIKNKFQIMGEKFNIHTIEGDLILLKPKLAYAAGRQPKVKVFKDFMDEVVDAVSSSSDKKKAIENFFILIEGVVAYHKFHDGKDN